MALPPSVLGSASPPVCGPAVVRMTTPVPGTTSVLSSSPAAGARVVSTPGQCRASCSRAVSPTYRSTLPLGDTAASGPMLTRSSTPFGAVSGTASPGTALGQGLTHEPAAAQLQRFLHNTSRARVHPPKATSLVPHDLPHGSSDILEDRGRRHFSPPPGASKGYSSPPQSMLPPGCAGPANDRTHRVAGAPSPPRLRHGDTSPRSARHRRAASPGDEGSPVPGDSSPHREAHLMQQSSGAVASCMRLGSTGDSAADKQPRPGSPHLQSSGVRSLLQDELSCGNVGDELRDNSMARSRGSPRRSPRRVPRPRDPTAAGQSQGRTALAGLAAAEGSAISASSAKEIQMEAETLQLREGSAASGLSPRSPRAHHQDGSTAVPAIGDLSCHELRHMGKAVAEANLRMREHFPHQAPPPLSGRPKSPVRSSLKRTKGTSSSAGPPTSVRSGSNSHAGHERAASRKGAASSTNSGSATPTAPTPRAPDPSTLPQAALCALRAELIQRSASGNLVTLAPGISAGSLPDVPPGVTLAPGISAGSLPEAAVASMATSSSELQSSPMGAPAMADAASPFRSASAGAIESHSPRSAELLKRESQMKQAMQMQESRITELRAEIEQLRSQRGESPAVRERSANAERAAAPPQVHRMVTPHSNRSSAPPSLPRTPHRQVSSDEAVVVVTSGRPPTPHRGFSAEDVANALAGRPTEASNRVRFDDRSSIIESAIPAEDEVVELSNQEVESEQTCWRRWESPKPGPGRESQKLGPVKSLAPGMKSLPTYPISNTLADAPSAPTALLVPVPAIAAATGSAVKRAASGSESRRAQEAALEAEIENVKRRHAEALEAELERVRQQHQAKTSSKKSPRTSFGGA